jgi:hypothetical protein
LADRRARIAAAQAGAEQDLIKRGTLSAAEALVKNILTRKGSREAALRMAFRVVSDSFTVGTQSSSLAGQHQD